MKALRKLYTANLNNEVVAFGTNLKDFLEALKLVEPSDKVRHYQHYYREFQKNKSISLIVGEKAYILQEVFNLNKTDRTSARPAGLKLRC